MTKTRSTTTAPMSRVASWSAEHGDDRDGRVAETVTPQRPAGAEPLGPRRADVVLALDLEHRAAHVARQHGALDDPRARAPAGPAVAGTGPGPRWAASSRSPGSQPSFTAKTVMSRMPARKAGTATPTCDSADSTTPLTRRCRTRHHRPDGDREDERRGPSSRTTSHRLTWSRSTICGAIGPWTRSSCPRSKVQQARRPTRRTASTAAGRGRTRSRSDATAGSEALTPEGHPRRVTRQHHHEPEDEHRADGEADRRGSPPVWRTWQQHGASVRQRRPRSLRLERLGDGVLRQTGDVLVRHHEVRQQEQQVRRRRPRDSSRAAFFMSVTCSLRRAGVGGGEVGLELLVVVARVVLRVAEDRPHVPGLDVRDDRHVVVGVGEDGRAATRRGTRAGPGRP